MTDPVIPTWGWASICGVLASTIATLAALYKGARDREVELAQTIGQRTAELLERAIEAFTLSKIGTQNVADKLEELSREVRELKNEVRRG